MLKIKDKDGKTKLVLRDEDDEPISIDELIIREAVKRQEQDNKKQEKGDAN